MRLRGALRAAARNQGRDQSMREKNSGVYLGANKPRISPSHAFGPTLMARGSFGAVRLAAARPFECAAYENPTTIEDFDLHFDEQLESHLLWNKL